MVAMGLGRARGGHGDVQLDLADSQQGFSASVVGRWQQRTRRSGSAPAVLLRRGVAHV
jgi:hypothetical protein